MREPFQIIESLGLPKVTGILQVGTNSLEDRQVKCLGSTHEGKKHDKKLCDEEDIRIPEGAELYRDSAYQGHEVPGITVHQPKKKAAWWCPFG